MSWSTLPCLPLQAQEYMGLWSFLCHICQPYRDNQGTLEHQNDTIYFCSSNCILSSSVETWHKNFLSEIFHLPHKIIKSLLKTDWVDSLGCAKMRRLNKSSISLLICYCVTENTPKCKGQPHRLGAKDGKSIEIELISLHYCIIFFFLEARVGHSRDDHEAAEKWVFLLYLGLQTSYSPKVQDSYLPLTFLVPRQTPLCHLLCCRAGPQPPRLTAASLLDTIFSLHDHSCNPLLSKYILITQLWIACLLI